MCESADWYLYFCHAGGTCRLYTDFLCGEVGGGCIDMDGKLRNMTSVYITRDNQVEEMLLLYRIGSRVVAPSWCGIGGHFEPEDLNEARSAALRELEEEIGLTEHDLENLELRYITLRLKNGEVRQNYYFFARLKPEVSVNLKSPEGIPEWVPLQAVMDRSMPYTARFVVEHYLGHARYDQVLYAGIAGSDGVEFRPLTEF